MLEKLEAELSGDPVLVAGAAPAEQVEAIEAFAGFGLPPSYAEFVRRYDAAIVGPFTVYGSGASEAMGPQEASVIDVTKSFRADGWPGTTEALVISMDHAGNAITLHENGHVHRYDHDSGTTEVIAQSFEGFLDWCLSLSAHPE